MKAINLSETYLHVTDGPDVTPIEVGPDFWQTIESRTDLEGGRLMLAERFESDWSSWEMHPAGEEIVVLTAGRANFVLDLPDGEKVIEMKAPAAVIVPRGTWHTMRLAGEPAEGLFVTRGAGTQHRPL